MSLESQEQVRVRVVVIALTFSLEFHGALSPIFQPIVSVNTENAAARLAAQTGPPAAIGRPTSLPTEIFRLWSMANLLGRQKRFSKSGSLAYRSQDFGFFKPFVFNDLGRETSDSLSRGW